MAAGSRRRRRALPRTRAAENSQNTTQPTPTSLSHGDDNAAPKHIRGDADATHHDDCRRSTADAAPPTRGCAAAIRASSDLPSEQVVDAYRDTVLHLRHCGLLAAPNIPAMRVLWQRSADDRRLIAEIAERWELAG